MGALAISDWRANLHQAFFLSVNRGNRGQGATARGGSLGPNYVGLVNPAAAHRLTYFPAPTRAALPWTCRAARPPGTPTSGAPAACQAQPGHCSHGFHAARELCNLAGRYSLPYLAGRYSLPFLAGRYSLPYLAGRYSLPYLAGCYSLPYLAGRYSLPYLAGCCSMHTRARAGRYSLPYQPGCCCMHAHTCEGWPLSQLGD